MNAARILSKAASLGVSLRLDGDLVRIRGPRDARDCIREDVAANKPEILAYLRRAANDVPDLSKYPVADGGGRFMPWCAPMSPERAASLLADLRGTIGAIADMERWADERRAQLLGLVARQPAAALTDDLEHFQARMRTLQVLARARNGTPFP